MYVKGFSDVPDHLEHQWRRPFIVRPRPRPRPGYPFLGGFAGGYLGASAAQPHYYPYPYPYQPYYSYPPYPYPYYSYGY